MGVVGVWGVSEEEGDVMLAEPNRMCDGVVMVSDVGAGEVGDVLVINYLV